MIDETAGSGGQSETPVENSAGQTGATGGRVAFCQQCGRELTTATVRRVGSAVYCEPCLVARLEGATPGASASSIPGYAPVNAGAGATYGGTPVIPAAAADTPSPGLAALLGLIPGVGAMYNGQFAKGVAHLVIFAILVSLADNVNGIFGLFVAGWIFYQAFEAYHTAKARRDGLPLPNAFGLNDIGERMGFGRNWPAAAGKPVSTASGTDWTAAPPPPPPSPATGWAASGATAQAASTVPNWNANWAGYVPPTSFGATVTPPPAPAAGPAAGVQQGPAENAWAPPPYGSTYAGEPWAAPAGQMPSVPVVATGRHFPIGAAWLIGLGLLFLLSNLAPGWRIAGRWLIPAVLAGLGSWLLYRRVELVHSMAKAAGEPEDMGSEMARRLASQVRWPVMLLVLALLFALQAAHALTIGQTWPVLFIALGALLLLERTVGRPGWYSPAGAGDYGRAGWTAPDGEPRKDGR